jgi:hypothetical protein
MMLAIGFPKIRQWNLIIELKIHHIPLLNRSHVPPQFSAGVASWNQNLRD